GNLEGEEARTPADHQGPHSRRSGRAHRHIDEIVHVDGTFAVIGHDPIVAREPDAFGDAARDDTDNDNIDRNLAAILVEVDLAGDPVLVVVFVADAGRKVVDEKDAVVDVKPNAFDDTAARVVELPELRVAVLGEDRHAVGAKKRPLDRVAAR